MSGEWNKGEENKKKVREGEIKDEGRINEMKQGKGFVEGRRAQSKIGSFIIHQSRTG